MKMSYSFISLTFYLFRLINSKDSESIRCLKVNSYNNIRKGSKIIGDKNKCFRVSNRCCFINITHYYGDYLLENEYCNYLNVNKEKFEQFLNDMYNDDEMYYANFTAHNLEMYQTIGRNLEENLTDKLNCFIGPKTNEEYSTFVVYNWKEFRNGVCTGVKNTTRFNEFVENFQKNYADAYCNKKEEGNKCVRYDGSRANDKMVKPLLDELADYLQADNDEYKVTNNETNVEINSDEEDESGESTFLDEWKVGNRTIKQCLPRPNVTIRVECPPGYTFQEFINFKLIKNSVLFLALLF